jgi:hypothetical protein
VNADTESYVRAVHAIRSDPAAALIRTQSARQTAERLDWSAVAVQFFELYDELHALVRGKRSEPLIPPAFFSTPEKALEYEAV